MKRNASKRDERHGRSLHRPIKVLQFCKVNLTRLKIAMSTSKTNTQIRVKSTSKMTKLVLRISSYRASNWAKLYIDEIPYLPNSSVYIPSPTKVTRTNSILNTSLIESNRVINYPKQIHRSQHYRERMTPKTCEIHQSITTDVDDRRRRGSFTENK